MWNLSRCRRTEKCIFTLCVFPPSQSTRYGLGLPPYKLQRKLHLCPPRAPADVRVSGLVSIGIDKMK